MKTAIVIGVVVHEANIGERTGAKQLLESLQFPLVRLQKILVDSGYDGADKTQ
ncbi:MAG TPA: hypothetical protein DCZ88_15490 [Pseudanabaena sp.]|nr:hypothetical protein [Pseudanabaena sp.]